MDDKGLVSVIIPVYNGERYLREAIESILAQTYRVYEIVLIDGKSTDGTEKIAKSYQQVRYISQIGHGLADAWNLGIEVAGGEFIAFLGYDDLWEPDKLRLQVDFLTTHPDTQCVYSRVKFFLAKDETTPPGFKERLLEGDHVGCMPEALLVRKCLFDLIGTFNPDLSITSDVDWFARAKDHHIAMGVIPRVLVHRRIHQNNLSIRPSSAAASNREMLRIMKQTIDRKRKQTPAAGRKGDGDHEG